MVFRLCPEPNHMDIKPEQGPESIIQKYHGIIIKKKNFNYLILEINSIFYRLATWLVICSL